MKRFDTGFPAAIRLVDDWQEFVCTRCDEPQRAFRLPDDQHCEGCRRIVEQERADAEAAAAAQRQADEERWAIARRLETWPETLRAHRAPDEYCLVPRELRVPASCNGWEGAPWSLTVLGNTGTGKTWLSTKVWGEGVCRLGEGVWIDVSMMIELIHADIRSGRARTLDLVLSTPVLLLDDLLAERSDLPFVRDKVSFILRTRYNDRAATIVNGNAMDSDPASPTYGQPSLLGLDALDPERRIGSRLSTGIVVKLTGPDRRTVRLGRV